MRLIFLILFSIYLNASSIEITAKNFYHKEDEYKAIFSINAVANDGNNTINADKIIVHLNKKNEAIKYEAIGNVKFTIKSDSRHIQGKSDKLIYNPIKDIYKLYGRVEVHDLLKNRDVYGDEMVIDQKNRSSYVKSHTKKPVKFIFKTEGK